MIDIKKYICLNCNHNFRARKKNLRKPRQCSNCSSSTIVELDFYYSIFKQANNTEYNPSYFQIFKNITQQNIGAEAKLDLIETFLSEVESRAKKE
ncbi:MAG: hypothetical protein ACE5KE_08265 [Methanosarcinales archaeon]